jgi:hypothetical protein
MSDGNDSTHFSCVNLKIVWYKLTTVATIGDIVLIYREEEPAFFARIEDISADKKADWYQVRLLILQIPLTETTWLLREEYINGEAFTIDSGSIRMEEIRGAEQAVPRSELSDSDASEEGVSVDNKVISLFERKRG